MAETDPTDLAQDIANEADELASIERDIADRTIDDPELRPLARKAEDVTRHLAEDAERQVGD